MRKRVAMAASLIHHPELFLMDEPFEGVDAVGARLMKDILLDQVRQRRDDFSDLARAGSGGAPVRSRGDHPRRQDRDRGHHGRICAPESETLEDVFVRVVGAEREFERLDWL